MNTIICRSNILTSSIRKCLGPTLLQAASAHKFAPLSNCSIIKTCILVTPENVSYEQTRSSVSGFFNKHTAAAIWKGVSSVSSAGRRRGRGKIRGKKVIRDLNRGQIIGVGKENIRFPGLSSPIIRGRELIQRQKLPPDENYLENLNKLRQPFAKAKKARVSPLDRGWSGGHARGRKAGPPDPVGDDKFEGFESIIFEHRSTFQMTRHMGRYRKVYAICGTGNGNGLFGFSAAKAVQGKSAVKRAKNRAGKKLMYIPRYEDRTIMHNFYSRFLITKIYAWKCGPGHGLVCHRLLKNVCQLIGIKDIYVKVEGGSSVLNILNAFLLGLLRQKTYEELATETKRHVVEMNPQNDYFPKLLASPNMPLESSEEPLDFELYCFDDNVYAWPRKLPPRYTKHRRWPVELRKLEKRRGHLDSRHQLINEYGELRSFLTDSFPECKPWIPRWSKVKKNAKKEEKADG